MAECPFCGSDVNPARADGLVYEDDEKLCIHCGSMLHVCIEEGVELDDIDVYFGSASRCRHGIDLESVCACCDETNGDTGPRSA